MFRVNYDKQLYQNKFVLSSGIYSFSDYISPGNISMCLMLVFFWEKNLSDTKKWCFSGVKQRNSLEIVREGNQSSPVYFKIIFSTYTYTYWSFTTLSFPSFFMVLPSHSLAHLNCRLRFYEDWIHIHYFDSQMTRCGSPDVYEYEFWMDCIPGRDNYRYFGFLVLSQSCQMLPDMLDRGPNFLILRTKVAHLLLLKYCILFWNKWFVQQGEKLECDFGTGQQYEAAWLNSSIVKCSGVTVSSMTMTDQK